MVLLAWSLIVLVCPLLVLVWSLVVLVCPPVVLVCPLVTLVCPPIVSVSPLVVLVVLSVDRFTTVLTPSQICQRYIFCMEISIRPDGFFKIHSNMWVNLIKVTVKTGNVTYNTLCHDMETKTSLIQTPSMPFIVKTWGFTKHKLQKHGNQNRLRYRLHTAIFSRGLKIY